MKVGHVELSREVKRQSSEGESDNKIKRVRERKHLIRKGKSSFDIQEKVHPLDVFRYSE